MTTTIKVSESTVEKLKNLKLSLRLPSLDAVIIHLVSPSSLLSDSESPLGDAADAVLPPQEGRKINVRPPLFSYAELADRPEMLDFYTGFNEKQLCMLTTHLAKVIDGSSFFPRG